MRLIDLQSLTVLCTLLTLSCSTEQPPPLPEIDYATMSADVRAEIEAAVNAVAEAPADPDANGRLGMLLDAYGKVDAARAMYARARYLAPETFRWNYLYAWSLDQSGDPAAALASLEQALALRPDYPPAQLARADLLNRQGDIAQAQTIYTTLIGRMPNYADAHLQYGKLLLEQGRHDEAIQALQMTLALSPRFGQAHYVLAQAYRQRGDSDLAATHEALFERYRLMRPPSRDPLRSEVVRLASADQQRPQRALRLLGAGKYAAAVEEYERLIEDMPDQASPHINLIAAYAELGRFDEAERHAQIAAALEPESVALHDNLGILRLRQRRLDEAEAAFRKAMEIDPGYSVPYRNLGAALAAAGRAPEAIEALRRGLALEPTARQIRFLLGQQLLAQREAEEAARVLEPLQLVTRADTPVHLVELGKAQLAAGHPERAVAVLTRAQTLAQVAGLEGMAGEIATHLQRARRDLQP